MKAIEYYTEYYTYLKKYSEDMFIMNLNILNNFLHSDKEFIFDSTLNNPKEYELKINKDATNFDIRCRLILHIKDIIEDMDKITFNTFASDVSMSDGVLKFKMNFK